MRYTITEKQNANSSRDGVIVDARSIVDAKRKASRMQLFCGTVLEISDSDGSLICRKHNGKWDN